MKKFSLVLISGIFLLGGVSFVSTALTSCSSNTPGPGENPLVPDDRELIITYDCGHHVTLTAGDTVDFKATIVDKNNERVTTGNWYLVGGGFNGIGYNQENGEITGTVNAVPPSGTFVMTTSGAEGTKWEGLTGDYVIYWTCSAT